MLFQTVQLQLKIRAAEMRLYLVINLCVFVDCAYQDLIVGVGRKVSRRS